MSAIYRRFAALALLAIWPTITVAQPPPKVFTPDTAPDTDFIFGVNLASEPPFVHWDLREFPDCEIPWALGPAPVPDIDDDGIANAAADRTAAIDAFAAAFQTWENVVPAVIEFARAAAVPPAVRGIAKDGHNTLAFTALGGDDFAVVPVGNDGQIVPVGDAVLPGNHIVHNGVPHVWDTAPQGDDIIVGNFIVEPVGGDGIANTRANNLRAVAPGGVVINPGPNGELETQPQGDELVDPHNDSRIIDGGDGWAETTPNNQGAVGTALGLTGFFFSNENGVILEGDIVFNPGVTWRSYAHGAMPALGTWDLQMIATHEIGHLIGLSHPLERDDEQRIPLGNAAAPGAVIVACGRDAYLATVPGGDDVIAGNEIREPIAGGNGTADSVVDNNLPVFLANPAPNAIMRPLFTDAAAVNHNLAASDTDACNFLYTPDLGDAPDPFGMNPWNRYPTHIHGFGGGRVLNGIGLWALTEGAEHLFGYHTGAVARYQYEWLGTDPGGVIDGECDPRLVDLDNDDGVIFPAAIGFVPGGPANMVNVHIRTAADVDGNAHAYADTPMYINAWFDWNANGDWFGPGEHVIGAAPGTVAVAAAGVFVFPVAAPAGAVPGGYARFRLDWGEDCGDVLRLDSTLRGSTGAAQFGEVEDYLIIYAGDLDADGAIGFSDFICFLAAYGHADGDLEFLPQADFDEDGEITALDFQAWIAHYRAANLSGGEPLPVWLLGVDIVDTERATGAGAAEETRQALPVRP